MLTPTKINLDLVSSDFAGLRKLKQILFNDGATIGDSSAALELVGEVAFICRSLRSVLEQELRDGTLTDMSPENARVAVRSIRMLEAELLFEGPEAPN